MQLPVSRRRSEAAPSPSHPQSRIYHGPRGQPASEGPSLPVTRSKPGPKGSPSSSSMIEMASPACFEPTPRSQL